MTVPRRIAGAPSRRAGFTLIELLIALVLSSFVAMALVRVIASQTRFYERQTALKSARAVARSALNILQSELRMVEAEGGVAAASPSSVTLRAPFAMGIHCGASGASSVVGLLPMDSLQYASASLSGYAWRDSVGNYHYVESGVTVGSGAGLTTCASQSITLPAGSRLVTIAPQLPAAAPIGTAVFLEQRVTYAFAPSQQIPGRVALWRTPVGTGVGEELAAPFDTTARFLFYRLDADTAQAAVPADLTEIRGLDIRLHGMSERAVQGRTPEVTKLTTGVFFKNRMD